VPPDQQPDILLKRKDTSFLEEPDVVGIVYYTSGKVPLSRQTGRDEWKEFDNVFGRGRGSGG
jgi:hypothetical protein